MIPDLPAKLSTLSAQQRGQFYERVAYNLTICIRAVWSAEKLTEAEKVDGMKRLNEIQHRITSKIMQERLHPGSWTDGEFAPQFTDWVRNWPALQRHVDWAISESLERAVEADR